MKIFKYGLKNVFKTFAMVWFAVFMAVTVSSAVAGDGHDHGENAPVETGETLPRFAAVSKSFELVGVVNGTKITLYLDRFSDNSPVKEAKIDLDLGGVKIPVEQHAEGEFEATLPEALKPGVIPVAATVIVDQNTDLLAGELDMHDETASRDGSNVQKLRWWGKPIFKIIVALLAIALIGWGVWYVRARRKKTRHHQQGDAA